MLAVHLGWKQPREEVNRHETLVPKGDGGCDALGRPDRRRRSRRARGELQPLAVPIVLVVFLVFIEHAFHELSQYVAKGQVEACSWRSRMRHQVVRLPAQPGAALGVAPMHDTPGAAFRRRKITADSPLTHQSAGRTIAVVGRVQ